MVDIMPVLHVTHKNQSWSVLIVIIPTEQESVYVYSLLEPSLRVGQRLGPISKSKDYLRFRRWRKTGREELFTIFAIYHKNASLLPCPLFLMWTLENICLKLLIPKPPLQKYSSHDFFCLPRDRLTYLSFKFFDRWYLLLVVRDIVTLRTYLFYF